MIFEHDFNSFPIWYSLRIMQLNALTQICPLLSGFVQHNDNFTDEFIYDTIEEMAPKFYEIIVKCRWKSDPYNCLKYVVPILTVSRIM